MIAADLVVGLLALLVSPPGAHLPWLTVGDLSRVQLPPEPALAPARLAALEKEHHPFVERILRTDFELRPDGTVQERTTLVRHFLSEEGVRQAGTVSVFGRATTDKVSIDEAYALAPGGDRTPFDPRFLQVGAYDQRDLFSDLQQVALPFPGLKAGSTLVLSYRRTRDPRRWPLPWSEVLATQSLVPRELFQLTVRWPSGKPRPHFQTNDRALTCQTGSSQIRCERRQVPGLPGDPEVSSWTDLLPHAVVTGGESWEQLGARQRALFDPGAPDARTTGTARRLVRGAASAASRVERLFRFVADEIRYVGFEHGKGAVVPRPPGVTLERRFGDCKDKVVLFLALARAVGIDAYPVLIASERLDPGRLLLPSWKYFDHVIACVRGLDETPTCLDPTDPHLPAGVVSAGIRSAVALPLLPGARPGRVPRSMDTDRYGWVIEVEASNVVACDGSIEETASRTYRGAGAGAMRGRLLGVNAADRTRLMEQGYARLMGEAVKPKVGVKGLEDRGQPVVLETVTRYPARSAVAAWKEYAEPDGWTVGIGKDFRTENRHHPYHLSGLRLLVRSVYRLCPTRRWDLLGPELDLRAPFGALSRTYLARDRLIVQTTFVLEPQTVAPSRLIDFNRFVDTVLGQTRIWFSLEPSAGGPR
jgi:transglutaminase-like putative cysteine protease